MTTRADDVDDVDEVAVPVESSAPRWVVRGTAALVPVAVLFAWYRGFRMPNIWTATLDAVSVTDGFHRRFLVGTTLRPFAKLLDFPYALFASFSFVVLASVVVTITVLALRTKLVSQRVLVIAWLVCGLGGYLFNEVGYFEQLLYLFLFAALWCLHRSRLVAASVLMVLAVLTHELTLLTVLPIFVVVAWKDLPRDRALKVLAAPVLLNLAVLLVPAASGGAVGRLSDTLLTRADFFPRLDALNLFNRTQTESWDMYSQSTTFKFLAPLAAVSVIAFLVVSYLGGRLWVLGALAIGAPLLLTVAGWDHFRWGFILLTNFFVIMWIWIGDTRKELDPRQWVTLALALVLMMHWGDLTYFDGSQPRGLTPATVWRNLTDGSFTKQPIDGDFYERFWRSQPKS